MKRASIVLLHGWGLSAKTFEPLARELRRRGYRVAVPDLPGFGASRTPDKPLTLSDYAVFLDIFLKKHHISQPILVGHSFGGRVSLKYQLLYQKSVRALILSGTPGFTPVDKKKLILFIFLAKIGKAFFALPPFRLAQEPIRRWYYYLVGARDYYRAEGVMRETFKHIVQEDLLGSMEAVHVPCLLVWGAQDSIVPTEIAHKMTDVIPGAEVEIIPNADHGVSFKQPKVFVSYVERFMKTL